MSSLGDQEREELLRIARRAVNSALRESSPASDFAFPSGTPCSGAFVTLRKRGRLRGCMGQIYCESPLGEVVAHCARSAALDDGRFPPVSAEELPDVRIEVSILSPIEPILPEEIVAGRHGLVVSRGGKTGVLLPQVASEFRWTAARFLEETCVKAGLAPGAWNDPATSIRAFTAEVFSEPQPWLAQQAARRAASDYSSST